MKIDELRRRLSSDRPMTSVTLRIPADVVEQLKEIAPVLGFSGYQPLIRAYVGQGLRADLERLHAHPDFEALVRSLRSHGVPDEVIASALAEARAG